jgi:hypothetical protein
MMLAGDNGQDASTGTVSHIQTELPGSSANDGGARNCVDAHGDSPLGSALYAGV